MDEEKYKIDIRLGDNSLVLTSETIAISYCNSLDRQLVKAIYQLQQENKQLKDKVGELTNSWNEQIKLTNQENLDCSKYAVENHHLKSVLDEIREYLNEFIIYVDEDGEVYFKEEFKTEYNDLLQILDKVKE